MSQLLTSDGLTFLEIISLFSGGMVLGGILAGLFIAYAYALKEGKEDQCEMCYHAPRPKVPHKRA